MVQTARTPSVTDPHPCHWVSGWAPPGCIHSGAPSSFLLSHSSGSPAPSHFPAGQQSGEFLQSQDWRDRGKVVWASNYRIWQRITVYIRLAALGSMKGFQYLLTKLKKNTAAKNMLAILLRPLSWLSDSGTAILGNKLKLPCCILILRHSETHCSSQSNMSKCTQFQQLGL